MLKLWQIVWVAVVALPLAASFWLVWCALRDFESLEKTIRENREQEVDGGE